jgi:hypothetical protein
MKTRTLACNAGNRAAAGRGRRAVQRVGRPLALFAIVFQLALAFAHHHFDLPLAHAAGNVPAAPVLAQADQSVTPHDIRWPVDAPLAPVHAPCLLCTAIHAAASLDAAVPPLALPAACDGAAVPSLATAPIGPPQRVAAFDCRGPPRA